MLGIGVKDEIGMDGRTVEQEHHADGVAILTFVCIGKDLSGFDAITHVHSESMDVAVESLQSIVVSDDNKRT